MPFDPRTSLLAGLPRAYLEARLVALQTALLELGAGEKVVTASYAQGDGTKSVTYRVGQMAEITALIRQLQEQLGLIPWARRPIRFGYR